MRVGSIERVKIELGEALRIELVDAAAVAPDMVHLQYYVVTDAGPWALWLTCPRRDLPEREAALQQLGYSTEP